MDERKVADDKFRRGASCHGCGVQRHYRSRGGKLGRYPCIVFREFHAVSACSPLKKVSSSAFSLSFNVVHMPWGAPS